LRIRRARADTKTKRIIAFFNTALGLWVLSSLVLGGLSFGYTVLSRHLEEQSKREAQKLRLRMEVAIRLARVRPAAEGIEEELEGKGLSKDSHEWRSATSALLRALVVAPSRASSASDGPIFGFPEFKERPLVSVILELLLLESDEDNQSAVSDLLGWAIEVNQNTSPKLSVEEQEKALKEAFVSDYWMRDPDERYKRVKEEKTEIARPAPPPAVAPAAPGVSANPP
jgi:hypothetical protein